MNGSSNNIEKGKFENKAPEIGQQKQAQIQWETRMNIL